jgi:hypothetical protein
MLRGINQVAPSGGDTVSGFVITRSRFRAFLARQSARRVVDFDVVVPADGADVPEPTIHIAMASEELFLAVEKGGLGGVRGPVIRRGAGRLLR